MVVCVESDGVGTLKWVVLNKLDPRHIKKNIRVGRVLSWVISGSDPVGSDPTYWPSLVEGRGCSRCKTIPAIPSYTGL